MLARAALTVRALPEELSDLRQGFMEVREAVRRAAAVQACKPADCQIAAEKDAVHDTLKSFADRPHRSRLPTAASQRAGERVMASVSRFLTVSYG